MLDLDELAMLSLGQMMIKFFGDHEFFTGVKFIESWQDIMILPGIDRISIADLRKLLGMLNFIYRHYTFFFFITRFSHFKMMVENVIIRVKFLHGVLERFHVYGMIFHTNTDYCQHNFLLHF